MQCRRVESWLPEGPCLHVRPVCILMLCVALERHKQQSGVNYLQTRPAYLDLRDGGGQHLVLVGRLRVQPVALACAGEWGPVFSTHARRAVPSAQEAVQAAAVLCWSKASVLFAKKHCLQSQCRSNCQSTPVLATAALGTACSSAHLGRCGRRGRRAAGQRLGRWGPPPEHPCQSAVWPVWNCRQCIRTVQQQRAMQSALLPRSAGMVWVRHRSVCSRCAGNATLLPQQKCNTCAPWG